MAVFGKGSEEAQLQQAFPEEALRSPSLRSRIPSSRWGSVAGTAGPNINPEHTALHATDLKMKAGTFTALLMHPDQHLAQRWLRRCQSTT